MSQLQWKPWHEVVQLRDELNKDNFSLSEFAADLYDVVMGTAKPIYQKPYDFFSFTYPTQNLRSLASEIIHRLTGKSDKAIRQLELTYGGGKTHTLITLYHLLNDPENHPDLPAIQEFLQQAGMKPPKTRFGVLPFDKIDVEKGLEAKSSDGKTRTLKYPWSILAWQIAGEDGLKLLHGEGKAEERDSAPAEPLLVELFSIPVKNGYSLLILIDEVLMYAHGKVANDSKWLGILKNFFQYLTQAIAKTNNTAMVVSLLSSDIQDTDKLGKEIAKELFSIFRRENEEGIRPVEKEDVAEIIRRRFFKADSIKDKTTFYPHVNAALFGMEEFNPEWKKERPVLESTFRNSYPFHPDLIDVFYLKWTNIETFQRTRGILRTFAFALRDSYIRKDNSPLVGSSIFLSNTEYLSNALKELCTVAIKDATEGKQQDWAAILDGELKKAKEIQSKATGVNHRELEQAVVTVFLHSQPIGKKASLQDITKMVSVNRPDKIGLRKAMQEWSEISWYLDEEELEDKETNSDGTMGISKSWRLGFKPNLRQLHHDALHRVSAEAIQEEFEERIKKTKRLKANVTDVYKIKLHLLPSKPSDVEDDGDFHFAILNLDSASSSSIDISKVAKRFLEENTGVDAPRKFKNSVILALPSIDGVEMIQKSIRSILAWREIPGMIKNTEIESQQEAKLAMHSRTAEQEVEKAIQAAYCMLATYSNKGSIECFKLAVDENPLIEVILKDTRSRITTTSINEETLLPEGPYNLWKEGDESRRVKILIESFAINTHLPKLLRKTELIETLRQGMKKGLFVLKSYIGNKRTYWKEEIPDVELNDSGTELVLNQYAVLDNLNIDLLLPSA